MFSDFQNFNINININFIIFSVVLWKTLEKSVCVCVCSRSGLCHKFASDNCILQPGTNDGTSLPERIKKDTWPTAIHLLSDPSELFSARKATDDMYHCSERQIQTLPCFYLVP